MPMNNTNPFAAELKKEIWAMEARRLGAMFSQFYQVQPDAFASLQTIKIEKPKAQMKIENGAAIINIHGILMKSPPAWLSFFGITATDYNDIQQQIAEALGNNNINAIMLHTNSPGGAVAGASETAEAIANANKIKPVTAYIEDIGASGAYYLASQASSITANPNAEIGSIGVYGVYEDLSKMAEMEGIKVIVIKSGEHKGMGVPGAEITDNQIKAIQDVIDGMNDNFKNAVAAGRKIGKEKVNELATGQVWIAKDALKLGLIDSIVNGINFSNTSENKTNGSNTKGNTMPENTQTQIDEKAIAEKASAKSTADERQRMKDLQAAFPVDPVFAMEQFTKGSDVTAAKAAYADVLATKNAELTKENTELKAKKPVSTAGEEGKAVETAGSGSAAAEGTGDFMVLAKERATEKKIGITDAMKQIAAENPESHQAFLDKASAKKVKVSGRAKRI